MQQSLAVMKLALQVLSATTERREPNPSDVQALMGLAPEAAGLAVDDLACEVVQRALEYRKKVRCSFSEGG